MTGERGRSPLSTGAVRSGFTWGLGLLEGSNHVVLIVVSPASELSFVHVEGVIC